MGRGGWGEVEGRGGGEGRRVSEASGVGGRMERVWEGEGVGVKRVGRVPPEVWSDTATVVLYCKDVPLWVDVLNAWCGVRACP